MISSLPGTLDDSGAVTEVTTLATRVLAPNPGPMTLEGTNSYVVRSPDSHGIVVIDPGPADALHVRRISALGRVELVLLTHHHRDHTASADMLAGLTAAPIRAVDPALCRGADPLRGGEEIFAAGTRISVLKMPGHTADSACFRLPEDRRLHDGAPTASILTGDTILGRGTTALDTVGGGSLADYLHTLQRLAQIGGGPVLPGHGPTLDDLSMVATAYAGHRRQRLIDIERVLAELEKSNPSQPATVEAITDAVYGELAPGVRYGAEASVAVHLEYLIDRRGS